MHSEILSANQRELLPLIKTFSDTFGLVGGTAIALHLGHRRSIDFDLFTDKPFDNNDIRNVITGAHEIESVLRDSRGEYTVIVNGVKCTFFHYPFPINFSEQFNNGIRLADLLTLAALKAYALGRRSTWKDYVDLYAIFIRRSLPDVVDRARQIFGKEFNEKLFRAQLAYFDDLDSSETIAYLPGQEIAQEKIKRFLTELALK